MNRSAIPLFESGIGVVLRPTGWTAAAYSIPVPDEVGSGAVLYWRDDCLVGVFWPAAYPAIDLLPRRQPLGLRQVMLLLHWLDLPAREERIAGTAFVLPKRMLAVARRLRRPNWRGGRRALLQRGLTAAGAYLTGRRARAREIWRWEIEYWRWQKTGRLDLLGELQRLANREPIDD